MTSPNPQKSAWLSPRVLLNALRARLGILLLATSVVFACLAALIFTLLMGNQPTYGSARTRDALEYLRVLEGSTLSVEPASPGLLPDLLISLSLAFAAGVAVVLLVEYFTPGHIRCYAALRGITSTETS